MLETLSKAVVALLPVLFFLGVLIRLDSHRLIGQRQLLQIFLCGGLVAIFSYVANSQLILLSGMDFRSYSRLLAPPLEEALKAAVLIWLFRRNRVGFQVDAAIFGFSVGAGFSFVENLFYLYNATEAHFGVWVIRGFGTAIMHGGCTAMFAVMAQIMTERHRNMNPLYYLPGLLAAILFHAIFNLFPLSPMLSAASTVLIIPLLLYLLVEKNEVSIHNFLEQDFDQHRRLLRQLDGGKDSPCETGRFVKSIQRIFREPVKAQMLSYIRLHTELVLSAEALLMARERNQELQVKPDTREKIAALHDLEQQIGKAGMHALAPHMQLSHHEFWLIHVVEEQLTHPPATA